MERALNDDAIHPPIAIADFKTSTGDVSNSVPLVVKRKALPATVLRKSSVVAAAEEQPNPPCAVTDEDALPSKIQALNIDTDLPPPYRETTSTEDDPQLVESPTSALSPTSPLTTETSKWKTALGDAKYFAGGLIKHPFEYTKHYSILRHSHGLVFYHGPSTSVAITIFSDCPLPPNRRLWLQTKGWTGKMGMNTKALLKSNSSWIDVTPSTEADASQLPPSDERAWQRDIRKFVEKAPKEVRGHQVRETDIIRIPYVAGDGYFRVVLTNGEDKKPLCPSPVFRVASTSASGSSIKGSSLLTLPLEIGVKVLSSAANNAAGNVISPVVGQVQSHVQQYVPSWATEVGSTAYGVTGLQNKVESANHQFQNVMEESTRAIEVDAIEPLAEQELVLNDTGPELPFPIHIDSKIASFSENTLETSGTVVSVAKNPDDLPVHLQGTFFGWAMITARLKTQESDKEIQEQKEHQEPASRFKLKIGKSTERGKHEVLSGWHKAVISIGNPPNTDPGVITPKMIRALILQTFSDSATFLLEAKITLVVLGCLSNVSNLDLVTEQEVAAIEVALSTATNWSAESALERTKQIKKDKGLMDRYVDVRQQTYRLANKVPLDKMGVRTPWAQYKDEKMGNGGLWISRE